MEFPLSETVGSSDINRRLDVFIHDFYERTYPRRFSRGEVQKFIAKGSFSIRGKVEAKPSTRLKEGDTVSGTLTSDEQVSLPKETLAIPIIFENEHFIIINKPAGIQVHPSTNREEKILTDWIKTNYPEILTVGGDISRPGIVHRLDRDTSGILVIAKTAESFSALKEQFHDRLTTKTYHALIYGNLPEQTGTISLPLVRKKDSLKRVPARKNTNYSGKIREAVTEYRVIRSYPQFDFVEVSPKTGRTHQIRAHFAALRHSVVGDMLYMGKDEKNLPIGHPDRQLLHASRLSFDLFGNHYDFEAPLPEDFKSFLDGLDS